MKRILALVLSVLMVLCLFAGCGKDEEKSPDAPDVNGDGLNGTAEKLHPALPCLKPDGKGSKDGKPETAADRKSEICNEDMAFTPRIHRG